MTIESGEYLMEYQEENKKLYPLKAGDVLECVSSRAWFTKGMFYMADSEGRIRDDNGDHWFEYEEDVPNTTLFKLKSPSSEWTEGQPPEELPEGKQVVVGYKLVDKPVLEVGKVYTDKVGRKWKAIYDNGRGMLMTPESGGCRADEWSYSGQPTWNVTLFAKGGE